MVIDAQSVAAAGEIAATVVVTVAAATDDTVHYWRKWALFFFEIYDLLFVGRTPAEFVSVLAALAAVLHFVPRAFGKPSILLKMFRGPKGLTTRDKVIALEAAVSKLNGKMDKLLYVVGEQRGAVGKHTTIAGDVQALRDDLLSIRSAQKANDAVKVASALATLTVKVEVYENVYTILGEIKDSERDLLLALDRLLEGKLSAELKQNREKG